MKVDKVEIAKEVLREMKISFCNDIDDNEWYISTDEDHIINAMLVFLEKVNNLK